MLYFMHLSCVRAYRWLVSDLCSHVIIVEFGTENIATTLHYECSNSNYIQCADIACHNSKPYNASVFGNFYTTDTFEDHFQNETL